MKQTSILLFILSFLCMEMNAQPIYQWASGIGGGGTDNGEKIAVDGSGNSYVTGDFEGTADFDPSGGTANLSSAGGREIFVAKYDVNGAYQWAFSIGGAADDFGYNIAVDNFGNCYITGYLGGANIDFDPGAGVANLNFVGNSDIYIAKYNSAGAYQWAFSIGGSGYDYGMGITTDVLGNCYVTGLFDGTNVDFDPGSGNANLTSGSRDIFVAKYDASGAYQWAWGIGGANWDVGFKIVADGGGNCYVTGYFSGTNVDFDPSGGTANLSSAGAEDIFVAKYDVNGSYQWAFSIGGPGYDIGWGIDIDGAGNCYVSGWFLGVNIDFDPGGGTANLSSAGNHDIFLAKYNANGIYQWASCIGGTNDDGGYDIAVDALGNCYMTGFFQETNVDFDPGSGVADLSSAGNSDIFVAQYDANGTYQWAFNIGGTGIDLGLGIDVGCLGTYYITGYFEYLGSAANIDFDPASGTANLSSVGSSDGYIAKYGTCSTLSVTATSTNILCNGQCNGTATANATDGTLPYTYLWNPGGQTTQTVTGLCAGNYVVTVTDATISIAIATVTITQPTVLSFTATITAISCIGENNGSAAISINGGTPFYTYSWSPSGGTNAIATGLSVGTYTISVIDINGCMVMDSLTITDKHCGETVYFPNAFTPNSDNKNDVFLPVIDGVQDFNMRVYNRWGELIFESADINKGWDGKYKGELSQEDIYICVVNGILNNANKYNSIKHITLLK